MSLSVGIIGLPNVGKSTLFNTLTSAGAEASNYPFCIIDRNMGVAVVPDPRLLELGRVRSEGRDYVVRDGDVIHFLFKRS